MPETKPFIRLLERNDIPEITKSVQGPGWNKPASQYERYLRERSIGLRLILVAFVQEEFAGYLTICWHSHDETFRNEAIPEIVDFNVLPKFRRQALNLRSR